VVVMNMSRRIRCVSVLRNAAPLVAALAAVACGGEDAGRVKYTGGPQGGIGEDPCTADDGYFFAEEQRFDFEKGRAQNWYASNDKAAGSWMIPKDQASSYKASPIPDDGDAATPPGRCGESQQAIWVQATGLGNFGAIGINFFPDPVDASGYDGISFWARRDETVTPPEAAPQGNTGRTANVMVIDQFTTQEGQDSFCKFEAASDSEKCDPFGAGIGLGTEWRFFAIRFDAMRQRGFGKPSPRLDTQALIGVKLEIGPGNWSLWFDDFAFFREPGSAAPPVGAGGAGGTADGTAGSAGGTP
jgi:hypothetical protein